MPGGRQISNHQWLFCETTRPDKQSDHFIGLDMSPSVSPFIPPYIEPCKYSVLYKAVFRAIFGGVLEGFSKVLEGETSTISLIKNL